MSHQPKSPEDLSQARILAQRLVATLPDPLAAVRDLGCVQSQDLPGAVTSIALRTEKRSLDEVVAAFDDGLLVRSWTMRGTLHTVASADLGWILALTGPRMMATARTRRAQLGIDDQMLASAQAVALQTLSGGRRATRTQMLDALDRAGLLQGVAQRGYHLLSTLAMQQVIVQGPMGRKAGGGLDQLFVLSEEWITDPHVPDDPVAHWAGAYLTGHGPASLADLVRWTGLTKTACRVGIGAHPRFDRLEDPAENGPGEILFHAPGLGQRLAGRRAETSRLLLLPGFDELVLGYADRSCTVPPEHAQAIVPGNNGMFKATVVDRGRVVGTWRRPTRAGTLPPVQWLVEPTPEQLRGVEEAAATMPV